MSRIRRPRRAGSILALTLIALVVVSYFVAAIVQAVTVRHLQSRLDEKRLQARWYSESAIQRARLALVRAPEYAGETWLIPTETSGTSFPVRVQIRVGAQRPAAQDRTIEIQVLEEDLDPQSAGRRVIFHAERTIHLSVAGRATSP